MLTLQDLTLLLTRGELQKMFGIRAKSSGKTRQNIHFCYWVEPPGGLRILHVIMGAKKKKKQPTRRS